MSPSNASPASNDDRESTVTKLRPGAKARLRPAESSPGKITVAEGFDGFAVLRRQNGKPPAGARPSKDQLRFPWFKIVAVVKDDQAASVQVSRDVLVVDFKHGFNPTARSLKPFAREYLESLSGSMAALTTPKPPVRVPAGIPGDCPIVTNLAS